MQLKRCLTEERKFGISRGAFTTVGKGRRHQIPAEHVQGLNDLVGSHSPYSTRNLIELR